MIALVFRCTVGCAGMLLRRTCRHSLEGIVGLVLVQFKSSSTREEPNKQAMPVKQYLQGDQQSMFTHVTIVGRPCLMRRCNNRVVPACFSGAKEI